MEGRLGRVLGRHGGGAGDGSHEVYPLRLLTVVRERCSAGGVRDDGLGFGRSSGSSELRLLSAMLDGGGMEVGWLRRCAS